MDDRFDRRELLLHLGDVLEAMRYVAKANRPHTSVAQLAKDEASLQAFEFLRHLAPRMSARNFSERAASAYALWPKKLLETELNRTGLASSVRRELFDDNPDGWESHVAYMRDKVSWFGLDLPEMTSPARTGWPWTPGGSAA